MYCNQCEQTARGVACQAQGVCGKKPESAELQDLLTYALEYLARAVVKNKVDDRQVDRFTTYALFTTLTNVNFDVDRTAEMISRAVSLAEEAGAEGFSPAPSREGLLLQARELASMEKLDENEDVRSLKQMVLYGVRGVAAYAYHAALGGHEDPEVYGFIHRVLAVLRSTDLSLEEWLNLALECGRVNIRAMELLDAANTGEFGHPVPTEVPLGHRAGKCILVSGHDLLDLKALLEQTEGMGIDIYTHGEMLPAHGYPELKKYKHLFGHYGTAWQNQKKEFASFPGAILMTTNCIQEPQETYRDNIFTTGPVGWPGVTHVAGGDFSPVIKRALELPGFNDQEDRGSVMVGFARNAVLGVADQIIEAVKSGAIRHFFLVGGCDGARSGRSYYSEFVEKVPADSVVLTLACGKFRFFDKKLGDIGGIPRLLDVGQCNDAFSAVQIALALAGAFGCGVNELPLSFVLSWYEQKAVSILLSLLYLGVKDIRLGPTLPAFISPNVLNVLVQKFSIKPITSPDEDLKAILGEK